MLIGSLTKEKVAMFLSALELRNIIEASFLPKRCECTLSPDLSMTVKVYADGQTDQLDLMVTGIDASGLVRADQDAPTVVHRDRPGPDPTGRTGRR